ncbi:MAG: hypothetical protein IPM60_15150 [Rhodospirillales bacterium]|nr:hypothetical protein [Rhodospirillales bacterium]
MKPLRSHRREKALPCLWHDYANLFPMLDAAAQDGLRADIAAFGVREPVVLFQGRILDGRNRYMAARDLGLDFPVADFEGTPAEALAYVLSQNLHRRHLTESQRATVAAKIANMAHGGADRFSQGANLHLGEPPAVTVTQAAEMLSVSERSVKAARKVQQDGTPELAQAVETGKVAVSAAAAVAGLPREEQAAVVAAGPPAVREKAKAMRAAKASLPPPADDEPPAEPIDQVEAKLRRELAKLTPEALVDDILGLRADLAEERLKRWEAERRAEELKADLAAIGEGDDMGAKVTRLLDEVRRQKGRLAEVQAQLARETRRANAIERERDKLLAERDAQIIPMDGAA